MKPIASTLGAFALSLAVLLPAAASADDMSMPPSGSAKIVATDAAIRGLWHDHIFWVRNVVVATLGKRPAEAKAAEAQVVANAHAIADSIKPFYGDAAGEALFPLLAGHYGAIKSYLTATAAGDKKGQDKATDDLLANADKIATFLSGANPNLPMFGALSGIVHVDGKGTRLAQYLLPAGDTISEPVFVERGADAAEGDGWLLAVVWRARDNRSNLAVFNATDVEAGPVALVHLGHRVPDGFHGNWVGAE